MIDSVGSVAERVPLLLLRVCLLAMHDLEVGIGDGLASSLHFSGLTPSKLSKLRTRGG
jgi:hypothetical protein